jgi:hypothetical protein
MKNFVIYYTKIKKIKISTYEKLNYLLINLSYQQYYLLYENKKNINIYENFSQCDKRTGRLQKVVSNVNRDKNVPIMKG